MTTVARDVREVRAFLANERAAGRRIGFVPTMGALHEGHLRLCDEARRRANTVIVSIFVNPLQFGPNEDYGRYPRTFDDDFRACEARGVECIFAPAREDLYPDGFSTSVDVSGLTDLFEGAHRPGHFRGVTTVVAKLFGIIGPCTAVFGRKDYQQWRVIDRMAKDLDLPVTVLGHATVRDPDGLARSSRNRYLSPEDRVRALAIARGLSLASDAHAAGERRSATLRSLVHDEVARAFDRIDYVELADADTLARTGGNIEPRTVILVAAHLGTTRLIDNIVLGEDARPIAG